MLLPRALSRALFGRRSEQKYVAFFSQRDEDLNTILFPMDDMHYGSHPSVNVAMDGGYFDVTHSFKVGPSTYHVLGLRQHRPTYGNTYYIFHCHCESSATPRHGSAHLPRIPPSDEKKETKSVLRKKPSVPTDPKLIKQTLEEVLKSENKTLITSIREELHSEKNTLLQSIEKETRHISTNATSASKTEREEILRSIKTQISNLEKTYEEHNQDILASIDALKNTLAVASSVHQGKVSETRELQSTLVNLIERQIEQVMTKHFNSFQSTLIDMKKVDELRATLIRTNEENTLVWNEFSTTQSDLIKSLFAEQNQYLKSLVAQQSKSSALDTGVNEQLRAMIAEVNETCSNTIESRATLETLNKLFSSQREHFAQLISAQQESISLLEERIMKRMDAELQVRLSQENTVITMTNAEMASPEAIYDRRPFKLSIETAEYANVFAKLYVDGVEYPHDLHTLCQRDPLNIDMVNCFVIPPATDEPFELTLYAKTNRDSEYRAAIRIQMPFANIEQPVTFPHLYQAFKDYRCVLVEPLRRVLTENEEVMLHLVLPGARAVSIRNGEESIRVNRDEFHSGVMRKMIRVRGNVTVRGRWDDDDTEREICAFTMV